MLTMVWVKLVPLVRNLHLGRIVRVLDPLVIVSSPVTLRQALVGAALLRVKVLLVSPMNRELVLRLVQ